jgi:trk system potassium uptake protein
MGARKTITKISKFSYFSLMTTIGIEQVVSPRLSAINTILQHIRRGKVLSAISIKGEQAEVMEAVAMETSDIVSKPLKNLSFPKGRHGGRHHPRGERHHPLRGKRHRTRDRIIIFATRKAIPGIEKILAVKLEYF